MYNSRRLRSSRPTSLAFPHFLLFLKKSASMSLFRRHNKPCGPIPQHEQQQWQRRHRLIQKSSFYDILLYSYACLRRPPLYSFFPYLTFSPVRRRFPFPRGNQSKLCSALNTARRDKRFLRPSRRRRNPAIRCSYG